MRGRFWRRRKIEVKELETLESLLKTTLISVVPRQQFVQVLQRDLMDYAIPEAEIVESRIKRYALLGLAGLFGMAFFMSIIVRAIVALYGVIRLLSQSRRPVQKRGIVSSATPVV